MRLRTSPTCGIALKAIAVTFLVSLCSSVSAVTLDELRNVPDLTPQKFASYFSKFEFRFRSEIQAPEVFLATESGDCDDYSTLAAAVLKEKGYTPRLISIRMPKVTHVVCYVEETQSYLDYSARGYMIRTINCRPELSEIAAKVAKSFHAKWASASEFTYGDGVKRLVKTVVEQDKSRFASLSQ